MARAEGVDSGHRGQHRAGKHTKKGQDHAKKQPRQPKGQSTGTTGGGVYHSDNSSGGGLLGRLFGKKR